MESIHRHADAYAVRVAGSDSDTESNRNADSDPEPYGHTGANCYPGPDRDAWANGDACTDGDARTDARADCHTYTNTDTRSFMYSERTAGKSAGMYLQSTLDRRKQRQMRPVIQNRVFSNVVYTIATTFYTHMKIITKVNEQLLRSPGVTTPIGPGHPAGNLDARSQKGFTLIETTVALVIILIALLGVAHSFTYAIMHNAGNTSRAQALAILQQEVETLRAAKWTSNGIDASLVGGPMRTTTISSTNGGAFAIDVTVDDDPFSNTSVDATTQLKEITVTARLVAPSPGWQFSVPATVVMRRTRGN